MKLTDDENLVLSVAKDGVVVHSKLRPLFNDDQRLLKTIASLHDKEILKNGRIITHENKAIIVESIVVTQED